MALKPAATCSLIFVTSLLCATPSAFGQPTLPNNNSSTAYESVANNIDPPVLAEVDRMKAEQKARSDESRNKFPSASQGNTGISLFVPPSTPVIVVVETEDGELVATEF